jgi:hypothetical protein
VNSSGGRNRGISKAEFLGIMNFPGQWSEWDMYPDELFESQAARYEQGHEEGSEHDRNGAFHWWLKREPDKKVLRKLALLSYLDADQGMGADVRTYIVRARHCDEELLALMADPKALDAACKREEGL